MNRYLYLLLSAVAASIGQVLFRKGAMAPGAHGDGTILRSVAVIVLNPTVILGLFFYGLSTMLWLLGLAKIPLSAAYPFTALTFVLVMIASRAILGEHIPLWRTLGLVLIIGGFILSSVAGE